MKKTRPGTPGDSQAVPPPSADGDAAPPSPELPAGSAPATGAPSQSTIWLLIAATTIASGAMYYPQPLLGDIARSFGISALQVGSIPSLGQLGYVAGLLLITPLGDVVEKRRLVVTLLGLLAVAFGAAALAPTPTAFSAVAIAIGASAVVVQILIPFVAVLSLPAKRTENLGNVLSGALIGVLLSRTLSGYIGAHLGWRAVYAVASLVMVLFTVGLRVALPTYHSTNRTAYPALIASLWTLVRDLPRLRWVSMVGAWMYAALCAFWTPLAFYLHQQFNLGAESAGAFGLLGVAGALAAKVVGRYADRLGTRRLVRAAILVMLSAFATFAVFGGSLAGLTVGVLLIDLGAQSATVSNQSEIYSLHPAAQTRLNTIYKMFYFVGGSLGTLGSAFAWQHWGWLGVCGTGAAFLVVAALSETRNKQQPR